ncbi:MAG: glycerol kinase GlpK [Spirochaetia bacterium]|nr:glycerol kinase GlpK [Spirochaetia bacterium]
MNAYVLSFDQSTSTTKALLFDMQGSLVARYDVSHRQVINEQGWVEHNPKEILQNTFSAARQLLQNNNIDTSLIKAVAISNQRETALGWDGRTGEPLYNAIVWQCGRARDITKDLAQYKEVIHERTGLHLSPYFSGAKFAWMLKHVEAVRKSAAEKHLVFSTVDSFLLYHLSLEKVIKTEHSNASRTQLLNLKTLDWDDEILSLFGLERKMMPQVCDSNALFAHTTLNGLLEHSVPICGVLGDSQGALYAQNCKNVGMTKATYGTGSSVMMNIGKEPVLCDDLVTSIAWSLDGKIDFVLEGNINYSGATISYLVEELQLISSAKEAGVLAKQAQDIPSLYFVPAFSGLGAPYWDSDARAVIVGLDRRCRKAELVKAAEEAIGYQIADIVFLMEQHSKSKISSLRVDGGPTNDSFLMQFQADLVQSEVRVAALEELSGQGPALIAAKKLGLLDEETAYQQAPKAIYVPKMDKAEREMRYFGWLKAIKKALSC